MPFETTWIDVEGIILSEVKQTEKKKILYDFTFMWDLKIKQQAHRYRDRLAVARGRSWALGEMGEGTQRYTISVIK